MGVLEQRHRISVSTCTCFGGNIVALTCQYIQANHSSCDSVKDGKPPVRLIKLGVKKGNFNKLCHVSSFPASRAGRLIYKPVSSAGRATVFPVS